MQVESTRFGVIEVEEDRLLRFPEGLIGFPGERRFVLIRPPNDNPFQYIQDAMDPALAFLVTDPRRYYADYAGKANACLQGEPSIGTILEPLCLVAVDRERRLVTINLTAPLLIDIENRSGKQVILSSEEFRTDHNLIEDIRTTLSNAASSLACSS